MRKSRMGVCATGLLLLALLVSLPSGAATVKRDKPEELGFSPTPPRRIFNESAEEKAARLKWWTDARFGMFIHFGLYSMLGRGEWVRSTEKITNEKFDSVYPERFNPDLFDARDWARRAKAAGMRYIVLTTKHHDGFCLWDTDETDYKITKTPFGRDLVREYVDACRAEGLRVGFYYSLIDWHHPDFTVDHTHPLRQDNWPNWDEAELERVNSGRDMARYRRYLFAQTKELLTRYGKIDIIWYDFTTPYKYGKNWKDWDAIELLRQTKRLQPGIIVNDRMGLMETEDGWDFLSPEQISVTEQPSWEGRPMPWETCQTFSGSWGYARDEYTWKEPRQILAMLVQTVAFNGNLILNVGPTGRGEFDERASSRLEAVGRWMHFNARSIYGCGKAPDEFKAPPGCALTFSPSTKRLYVHILEYPLKRLPIEFADRVAYAQFLHDGSEVKVAEGWQPSIKGSSVTPEGFVLPVRKPNVDIPVVEVFLKD